MMNSHICSRPFTEIEIHTDGNVYTCCPAYLNNYSIGNIFKVNSFDEIWYSKEAINLRQKILDCDYSFCNKNICDMKFSPEIDMKVIDTQYPELVRFAYDSQCNLKCIFCRDSLNCNKEGFNEKYDALIETLFLPILKNAKIMSITSSGEITASKHSQKIIKKAAQMYPNLKFELLTNGLLFNEKFVDELGIVNKIERIVVSLHAARKTTYETIMRGSKYDLVHKNLEWIFSLKKSGKIKDVCLIFVACSLNYREIPEFIDFAIKSGATATVWEYRNHQRTKMDFHYNQYAVWEKTHPKYNDFVRVMKFVKKNYQEQCRMPEIFNNLEEISFWEALKNRILNSRY